MRRKQFDYYRLLATASSDPDIVNLEDLEKFVVQEVRKNDFDPVVSEAVNFSGRQIDRMLQKGFTPEKVQDLAIRGASARPGFETSLLSESLRNEPNEDGEFEQFRSDSIPLSTYKKMKRDETIALSLFILKGWITGLKHSIDSSNKQQAAVISKMITPIYSDLIRDLLQAVAFGFSFGEKVWQRQDLRVVETDENDKEQTIFSGKVVSICKIKFVDPEENFRYYKDAKTDELVRVTQQQFGGEASVRRKKLVWFAVDREFSGIFGNSRFKNVYASWYYSNIDNQQMLRHTERCGSPPLKIRYPSGYSQRDGVNVTNLDIAVELGRSYLNQGVAIMPSDRDEDGNFLWDVDFDDVPNSSNQTFLEVLTRLDAKKSDGLGIPSSVSQSGESTFAEAQAQAEMLLVIVEDLVDQLETVIQRDIVDQLTAFNFGPEFVDDVRFSIDKSGLGRRKLFKDILINQMRIDGANSDWNPKEAPDVRAIMEEFGVPTRSFIDSHMPALRRESGIEDPALVTQQDEDGNDENRNRPNPSEREPQRDSPRDDNDDTGG